jgi:hypothetical protein
MNCTVKCNHHTFSLASNDGKAHDQIDHVLTLEQGIQVYDQLISDR